jgi:hypothetical protein
MDIEVGSLSIHTVHSGLPRVNTITIDGNELNQVLEYTLTQNFEDGSLPVFNAKIIL